jgi:hypothetical protein
MPIAAYTSDPESTRPGDALTAQVERGQAFLARALDVHQQGMAMLEGVKLPEDWHVLMIALATRSYNSLVVAASAVRAYPIQAMILARAVYEDIQTADYIHANPTQRCFWLDPKYAEPAWAEKVPRFGTMRKAMPDEDMALGLKTAYFMLSQFGHPTVRSLQAERLVTADFTHFHYGPRSVPEHSLAATYSVVMLAANALRVLGVFVKREQPTWWQAVEVLVTDVTAWLNLVNQDLAPADDSSSGGGLMSESHEGERGDE